MRGLPRDVRRPGSHSQQFLVNWGQWFNARGPSMQCCLGPMEIEAAWSTQAVLDDIGVSVESEIKEGSAECKACTLVAKLSLGSPRKTVFVNWKNPQNYL